MSSEPEPGSSSSGAPSEPLGIEYGFVGVHCDVDDPHDDLGPMDYVDEVRDFSSIAHVCALELDVTPRLEDVSTAGMRALLDVNAIFFEPVAGRSPASPTQRLALSPNAQLALNAFVEASGDMLTEQHVAALFLADEPVWNGVTEEELAQAAQMLDAAFPEIPIVVVEAYPVVEQAVFPAGVDWVGFDHYTVADPLTDPDYQAELAVVRARASADQQLVVVMDAQWHDALHEPVGLQPEDMGEVALRYRDLVLRNDDVAALIGYTWPGGLDEFPNENFTHLGARRLPEDVKQVYADIGVELLGL